MPNDKLFIGEFNVSGQSIIKYTHAPTIRKAFHNFISQIAELLNIGTAPVYSMFDGSKDNYYIKEIK